MTVIKRVDDKILASGTKKPLWLCRCECGKEKTVLGDSLRNGNTKSCGCHKSDPLVRYSTKHGKRYERIYETYCGMKKRCYNKHCAEYNSYGGKGIKLCDEWLNDFMSFYNWAMENGYKDDLTIDRIDSSKNYDPQNCQWITRSENITKRNIEYWRKWHESHVGRRSKNANQSIQK